MKFKNFQLIIADDIPTKTDIQKICNIGMHYVKDFGSDWYEVDKSFIEERFLWIYCQYDNATIYNDFVFNGESDEKELNPRKKPQVELRKQFFVCYDTKTGLLYMNNIEKRGFVKHYISYSVQKEALIKNIYTTLEEFQNAVKVIKTLKFVQERNIMNNVPNCIFQQQANIYGLDNPEKIMMQVDYGGTPIGQAKNALQSFKKMRDSGEFESIVLVGLDDLDVEQSFDFSSLIQAIEITVEKNENVRYNAEDVRNSFLNRIR